MDNGNVVDILYYNTFLKMKYKREQLQLTREHIYGFINIAAPVVGTIFLQLTLGERSGNVSRMTEFTVVKIDYAFNIIIGRPSLHAFKAVPSAYHQCLL